MKYEIICVHNGTMLHFIWLLGIQQRMHRKQFEWIKCASQCVFYTRFNTCSNRMPLRLLQLIDDAFWIKPNATLKVAWASVRVTQPTGNFITFFSFTFSTFKMEIKKKIRTGIMAEWSSNWNYEIIEILCWCKISLKIGQFSNNRTVSNDFSSKVI